MAHAQPVCLRRIKYHPLLQSLIFFDAVKILRVLIKSFFFFWVLPSQSLLNHFLICLILTVSLLQISASKPSLLCFRTVSSGFHLLRFTLSLSYQLAWNYLTHCPLLVLGWQLFSPMTQLLQYNWFGLPMFYAFHHEWTENVCWIFSSDMAHPGENSAKQYLPVLK